MRGMLSTDIDEKNFELFFLILYNFKRFLGGNLVLIVKNNSNLNQIHPIKICSCAAVQCLLSLKQFITSCISLLLVQIGRGLLIYLIFDI